MKSLASADTDVKVSGLNGVLVMLTDIPQSFSEHVTTLLPCLLSLVLDKSSMVS